ncbi:condensation domain-containing protein [Streptomyces sp. TRM75563]|uniref:condensation domain-containing protein n=1 Tax=Streptomyces sp. TRM75563 TaxID=2817418 RepID=UPI001F624121|nr:condensation domain-containing protein [Streptomyces sp. TRM75563]MCI4039782.1 condensation domain-containing protein [Streptomyces sp. TRM75563]
MTTILHDRPAGAEQYALWAEAAIDPSISGGGYFVATLRGAVDERDLETAARAVLHRHEPLRSVLRLVDGQLRQCVLPAADACSFERSDLPCEDGAEKEAVRAWREHPERHRHWDLGTEAPLRFRLLTHAPDRRSLVFEAHHAGFDGRSKFLVAQAFSRYLDSIRAGLPVHPTPLLSPGTPVAPAEVTEEAIAFWRGAVDEAAPIALPEGGRLGRRTVASSPTVDLDPASVTTLRTMARTLRVSTFTMLLAALTRQLAVYDNSAPLLALASDVSDEHTRHVAGLQINIVPITVETPRRASVEQSAGTARRALARLARYRRVPFVDLVAGVPGKPLARLSTELGLSFPRPPADLDLEVRGLRTTWDFFTPNTNAALARTLQIRADWPHCRVRLDYRQDLMGAPEAEQFLADFRTAVSDFAGNRTESSVAPARATRPEPHAHGGTPYRCAGVRTGTVRDDDAPHPPRLLPTEGVTFTVHGRSGHALPRSVAGALTAHLPDRRDLDTGDCGYVGADGDVRLLGPWDGRWIRTRGLIDASTVARVARTHPWVREAQVRLEEARTRTAVLTVTGSGPGAPTARELRAHLRTWLHGGELPGRIRISHSDTATKEG